MSKYMDEMLLEHEAELEVKSKAYLASPQCAIDDARMEAKSKLENERRLAWEYSLTPDELKHHFGEEDSEQ